MQHGKSNKKHKIAIALPLVVAMGLGISPYNPANAQVAKAETAASGVSRPGANFPDYGFAPPDSYTGPRFRLSQNYPQQPPTAMPDFFKQLPETRSNDYETWRTYMDEAKKYCLEGNAQTNWRVEENKVRNWYHMPWQHYGPMGREGINGLTKEAAIQPGQLATTQTSAGQTYAVGIYNDIGAYTIGKVWQDPNKPDLSHTSKPYSFGNGTVVCKALFADIPLNEVPFLKNPVQWQGYITTSFQATEREIKPVYLIQMDIAVRDTRISETGWLFGTFQYNGAQANTASWDNLQPVGIMWGNDPDVRASDFDNPKPEETKINPAIKQSAINANAQELPPTHLGWNGRLNGPVDNPVSSCLSCHMTAQSPALAPMNPSFQANAPEKGSDEWMKWFQNIPAGVPFSEGAQSTDYSLQLAQAIESFCKDLGEAKASQQNACVAVSNFKLKSKQRAVPAQVFPIVRDASLADQR